MMKPHFALVLSLVIGAFAVGQTDPDGTLPPGHPPITPLPPDHPPVDPLPPGHPPITPFPADADDVASPRALVAAYYDSISGPTGQPRDWDRFRSLFLPRGRLMTAGSGPAAAAPMVLTPDEFIRINDRYLERSGYVERSIGDRLEQFGDIAHLWSTYDGRRGADAEPHVRGITSFQLVRSAGRWWIAGVLWDREREGVALPPAATGSPPRDGR